MVHSPVSIFSCFIVRFVWLLSFDLVMFTFCLQARLHDRAKMARARQKLERFQQFLQRNSELLSVPRRFHRRLWTRRRTDKTSLFLCKNCWNCSSFCRARAIFALSCKRALVYYFGTSAASMSPIPTFSF